MCETPMLSDPPTDDQPTYSWHDPEGEQELSVAIIEAIDDHDRGVTRDEFVLYNHINPDAVDNLFLPDAEGNVSVEFDVEDVTVTLWGDGGVDIRITDDQ